MQPRGSILEKERREGEEGPKGEPLHRVLICKSGKVSGPSLCSTHLIDINRGVVFKDNVV